MRTLGPRDLNRALLARQMLIERVRVPVAEALERLVGMQAQEPQAPYVGLWNRLAGFDPADLSGLIESGDAVRGWLMRSTIHLVSDRDYGSLWPLLARVQQRNLRSTGPGRTLTQIDRTELLELARAAIATAPRTRAELGAALQERWPAQSGSDLSFPISLLLPVIQPPPRGLWRRGGQARLAVADVRLEDLSEEAAWLRAADAMMRRYLAAFGPATVMDAQAWCGLTRLGAVVSSEGGELRRFRDEQGRELLDIADGLLPDPETPVPVRFLAPFDNAILAHADRSRIISRGDRDVVFRDRLMRTFTVDGFVAGTWQLSDGTLHIRPLRGLRGDDSEAVAAEAAELVRFLARDERSCEMRFHPQPMSSGARRNGGVSYWYSSTSLPARRPALAGDRQADVCIVGAGFTGLWAAYYLKRAAPELEVVMLEREFAGFGASGRNGGWLSSNFAMPREAMKRQHGREPALALIRAMQATVGEVIDACRAEGSTPTSSGTAWCMSHATRPSSRGCAPRSSTVVHGVWSRMIWWSCRSAN